QGHAVERQDFFGSDHARRRADLGRVLQQALRARLDSGVPRLTRDLEDSWRRRRHQGGAVEVDRDRHFSRITPKVRPATMYLRPITMSTRGIAIAITPAAAMSFQIISNWVTSPWTPT